jgi:hypothetical protein
MPVGCRMYIRGFFAALMLACAAFIMSCPAQAQARGPVMRGSTIGREVVRSPEEAAAQITLLTAWLQRLPGNYELNLPSWSGVAQSCRALSPSGMCTQTGAQVFLFPDFKGLAECRGIGAGPGVRCVLQSNGASRPGLPMVILFGIQAEDPGIRLLSVDVMGVSREARGALTGSTLRLDTGRCPNRGCSRILDIQVRSEGRTIEITYFQGRSAGAPMRLVMQRQSPEIAVSPPESSAK